MATKNSDKITLANLVSIIGIVLLAFLFYCGIAVSGAMSVGLSILLAVGLSAVIGFILWLLLHAKGVENDFKKWRGVEIASLVLFVLVSLGSSWLILNFTNVLFQKQDIQRIARNDIQEIKTLISNYQSDATEDYNTVRDNIIAASQTRAYPNNIDAALKDTLRLRWGLDVSQLTTQASVNNFLNGTDSLSMGIRLPYWIENIADLSTIDERNREPQLWGPSWTDQLERCSNIINSWDIFSLPQAMQMVKNMKADVPAKLTDISKTLPLHPIQTQPMLNARGRSLGYNAYKIERAYEGRQYNISSTETNWFGSRSVVSIIVGLIIALFLYFVVIFNYIVAYRSRKVEIRVGNGRYSHGRPIM